ncbi:hypothetical protein HQQ81_10200 [Microbacteriaceae bacterium VKM Ac-2854]|nr:hypothetical protein [Microbacteriaceae bacterium VKM Ac-2854]
MAEVVAPDSQSSEIPIQPLRSDTLASGDSTAMKLKNEPVWTRTCERGYGDEIWNDIDADVCAGTVTYYYYNVSKGDLNMLAYQASLPSRADETIESLDAWCNDHSFQCSLAFGVVEFTAGVLFGIATAGTGG